MTESAQMPLFDFADKGVYVPGHAGMIGAAIVRRLSTEPCAIPAVGRTTLGLTRQAEAEQWMRATSPDAVIVAAAKVGGIGFNNTYPVDFLADNLAIALNVIRASHAVGVSCSSAPPASTPG